MTQDKANKIFKSDLGQQLDEIFSTSDDRVFIRYDEAVLHTNGSLDMFTEPLKDKTILTWYNTDDVDILEDIEFYDLMQEYRHSPITDQKLTSEKFENVKNWIRKNYK